MTTIKETIVILEIIADSYRREENRPPSLEREKDYFSPPQHSQHLRTRTVGWIISVLEQTESENLSDLKSDNNFQEKITKPTKLKDNDKKTEIKPKERKGILEEKRSELNPKQEKILNEFLELL